jgi:hypothetical protein
MMDVSCLCSCSYSWPEKGVDICDEKYRSIVEACLTVDPDERPSIDGVLQMLDDGCTLHECQQTNDGVCTDTPELNASLTQNKTTENHLDVPNLIDL